MGPVKAPPPSGFILLIVPGRCLCCGFILCFAVDFLCFLNLVCVFIVLIKFGWLGGRLLGSGGGGRGRGLLARLAVCSISAWLSVWFLPTSVIGVGISF